jgi:uncharacterized protein YodC (DUF2158 family)
MTFKIGDVVRLKGGSPTMTVTEVGNLVAGGQLASCKWFDKDGKEQLGHYPAEALTKVEASRPSNDEPSGDWQTS